VWPTLILQMMGSQTSALCCNIHVIVPDANGVTYRDNALQSTFNTVTTHSTRRGPTDCETHLEVLQGTTDSQSLHNTRYTFSNQGCEAKTLGFPSPNPRTAYA
jgi:hypothetical protein